MTDVSIDCAVKLIGTNCIIYPVNSKDLQHIWVSPPAHTPVSLGLCALPHGSTGLLTPSEPACLPAPCRCLSGGDLASPAPA